jgi:hypothetical protein
LPLTKLQENLGDKRRGGGGEGGRRRRRWRIGEERRKKCEKTRKRSQRQMERERGKFG